MAQVKHTPGPWKSIPWDGMMEIRDSNNEQIARLGQRKDGAIPTVKTRDNANLIVAAPELLEACRLIAGKHFDDSVGRTAVLVAEAAIAKATGNSKRQSGHLGPKK